ncbi:MAG: LacI family DNA-binding transcriptional regulator [Candidatus Eisenbacteria bacterium]
MANIKDVAREAGVSVATVSRVFNDSEQVSDETRQLVRDVAGRLRYWPNGVARSLITNRTQALGVLLPDLYGEFFSELIRGIDLAARSEGFHLLVSSSHSDTHGLVAAMRSMRGRVDGLVIMAPDFDSAAAMHDAAGEFPVVILDPGVGMATWDTISIANQDGASQVVRHLVSLGHRRIATVTGPRHNIDAQQRIVGYRAALAEAGIAHDPQLELEGDFTEPSGYRAVAQLLAIEPRPTAALFGNDYMAIGAMSALSEAGLRVPEDFAVAGFDDIAMARYLTPALTTVHVDLIEFGARAVRRLLEVKDGAPGDVPRHEVVGAQLVIRRSCGALEDPGAAYPTHSDRRRRHS